ncbi:MAG: MBOAT family protein [Lachnospiraceae bacterium]|nr:MBOAT family protein [Lachnospiraceae bacterium]
MVFSSIIFLFCFFPAVLFFYFCICRKNMLAKNLCLLLASLVFYAFGEGKNIVLLLFSIAVNYFFGLFIAPGERKHRKLLLFVAVACDLSLLFIYKYLDFTITNINRISGAEIPLRHIALPIGISFFTFQAISYVIDVYRGKVPPQKNPLYVGLYISLFPQLVAGPIVRYETIMKEINERKESFSGFADGTKRFICGMGKKILLADTMSLFADRIMAKVSGGDNISVSLAWLGALCYTLRIYYDFAGYSDMAIGLGRIFGFRFEENFNYPYTAVNIGDFWRRWHISLASWFRDYVYIPLGGSRVSLWKQYRNILVVWMLTGLWHGAAWNYVLWGTYYAILLMFERLTGYGKKHLLPKVPAHILTVFLTLVGMTIFASPTLAVMGRYLGNMFGIGAAGFADASAGFIIRDNLLFFAGAIAFSMPLGKWLEKKKGIYEALLAAVFGMCIIYIIKGNYSPFIYFNF